MPTDIPPLPKADWQALQTLYPALQRALRSAATSQRHPSEPPCLPVVAAPAGTTLFRETEACQGFPLVLEGEVRVSRSSTQGRELEL